MSLRESNKAEKRRRILDAARSQFASLGFDDATVRAIAKEAGVGLGTVLLYFESKHALLLEVWRERVLLESACDPDGASEPALVEGAMRAFSPFLRAYAKDLALARVVVRHLPWLEGRAAELHLPELRAFLDGLASLVVDNRRRGCIREDASPELVATTFFSLYYGACLELTSPIVRRPLSEVLARLEERLSLVALGLVPETVKSTPRRSRKTPVSPSPRPPGTRS